MIESDISNGELASVLESMNWEYLKKKRSEFIVRMVINKIRKQGWKVRGQKQRRQIVVNPVTIFSKELMRKWVSPYVYEVYRGWIGEVVFEKDDNCKVRIRQNEKSDSWITTFILNKDLQDYDDQKGVSGKHSG